MSQWIFVSIGANGRPEEIDNFARSFQDGVTPIPNDDASTARSEGRVDLRRILDADGIVPELTDLIRFYRPPDNPGRVEIELDCFQLPPVEFLEAMTTRFPSITFHLSFGEEYVPESYVIECKNGESEMTKWKCWWFNMCKEDDPLIHYYDIGSAYEIIAAQQTARNRLQEMGILVREHGRLKSRWAPQRLTAWLEEHCEGAAVELEATPFTLNETFYLQELNDIINGTSGQRLPDRLCALSAGSRKRIWLMERDICLTATELDWLVKYWSDGVIEYGWADHFHIRRLERLRNQIGRERFDGQYLESIVAWSVHVTPPPEGGIASWAAILQAWFSATSTPEVSQELGYDLSFGPTRKELEVLLREYERQPDTPDRAERVALIGKAILAPRWKSEWPDWDDIVATWREYQQAEATSSEASPSTDLSASRRCFIEEPTSDDPCG